MIVDVFCLVLFFPVVLLVVFVVSAPALEAQIVAVVKNVEDKEVPSRSKL